MKYLSYLHKNTRRLQNPTRRSTCLLSCRRKPTHQPTLDLKSEITWVEDEADDNLLGIGNANPDYALYLTCLLGTNPDIFFKGIATPPTTSSDLGV